jgi:pilus assembly protein Flp/PilA
MFLEGGSQRMRLIERIGTVLRDEEAATAVEYAVLLALILMAILGAIGAVGSQSGGMWNGIEGDLQDAGFYD